ncbi:MAG: IclR family transcriptional regulator [Pirellulaceae bacterium]|nr:IclR family transcriptional regulator [Pirellulaceae bacterium]
MTSSNGRKRVVVDSPGNKAAAPKQKIQSRLSGRDASNGESAAPAAVPAVARALDVIEYLADHTRPFGINELARQLKIPVNSVFRILKCLEARGYVETEGTAGGYQLSTRFFSLGMRLYTRFELRRRAQPHLETLCQQTGESAQIYQLDGDAAVVLDCITPEAPWFLQFVPGTRMELLHAAALSKAILAFFDEDEICRLLPQSLQAATPNTITDRDRFLVEAAEIRRTGLTYDHEEYVVGVYCVGAAVFDVHDNVVAGAGVSGLVSRFHSEDLHRVEQQVLECARRISMDIGNDGRRFDAWIAAVQRRK